jgi:hypothetical protein
MSSNRKKDDGRTKIIRVSTHDQNFRRENFIHENYYNFFIRVHGKESDSPKCCEY